MAQCSSKPLVALFGYDSSLFTQKVQHVLRLKKIPHIFVTVPSMMPRPILKDNFNITYRKIPVLAINRDIYIDTSMICEALEQHFPAAAGFPSIYPRTSSGATHRSLIRGMASYWTDRPVFRATCGLMPTSVWRSKFGSDRAQLIGHKLDADKLQRKMPEKLSEVDMQCSMLETMLQESAHQCPWIFDTQTPSMADIAWYVQLDWGIGNARGKYIEALTAGDAQVGPEAADVDVAIVWNSDRYPKLFRWHTEMQLFLENQPLLESRINHDDKDGLNAFLEQVKVLPSASEIPMLPTPASPLSGHEASYGLERGASVAITPEDTGRGDPTVGTIVATSPEEVVISPKVVDGKGPAVGEVRLHFPRLGFIIQSVNRENSASRL